MSKKLLSSSKWKEHLKARDRAEMRKLSALRKRGPVNIRVQQREASKKKFLDLLVPSDFSLVNNPEEFIRFLRSLELYSPKYNLSLDLRGITSITTDAIAALIASIKVLERTIIRGNQPSDPTLAEILSQSGFFDHVKRANGSGQCNHGREFCEKASRKVEPGTARDLIHFRHKGHSRTVPALPSGLSHIDREYE